MHDMGWGNWWMMGWWLILPIAIIVILLFLAGDRSRFSNRSSKAEDILKERYARGEITKEEFDSKMKDIT